MEISHREYMDEGHYLRWFVIAYTDYWVGPEHRDWCEANCKSLFCLCGSRFIAFESKREALFYKMVF
ncbi:hypothetical protein D3C72_194270 [compost metagenome]